MSSLAGYRILLLEDDECYRTLFMHALARQAPQHRVEWVATVEQATVRLKVESFDAVVSDLNVPDSFGLETISKLRACDPNTPIIALTGDDNPVLERKIIAVGAQDYLVKGYVGGRDLSRAIHHSIERQLAVNKTERLAQDLAESHALLKKQAMLLQRKNRKLKRMNELAGEFVDNVSHDLRTPLTVITDYVSLIREGIVGDVNDEQAEMLQKVAVRADDLNNMVDDLLDVSKLDAGMLGCWRRPLRPEELFEHVRSLLEQRASVLGVELTIDCAADLPDVFGDREKAIRVITNLAVNAIKFSGRDGKVTLTAENEASAAEVVFGVRDTGPGIEADQLEKLFERFEQAKPSMSPSQKGFGLGLSIARKFIRMNLGEMSVQSRVGEGSTFSFTLPHAEPAEVFDRWLRARRSPEGPLQLVELSVDDASTADDFDQLVNAELRRDDLLIRINKTLWALAIDANTDQVLRWKSRFVEQYEAANRNRRAGSLPRYEIEQVASWTQEDPTDERSEQFAARIDSHRSEQYASPQRQEVSYA